MKFSQQIHFESRNSSGQFLNQQAVFLLAIWGKSYIESFFEFSLPSLLAPGNLPCFSKEFRTSFLFLTKQSDIHTFKSQPLYPLLESVCTVEFVDISDLIFESLYSATLTLAYERGMRAFKEKICNTYFFFLVSDYIFADGSIGNLSRYLNAGYSGITAGNFLVVEEYISEFFLKSKKEGILSIKPRDLLAISFSHMHPVSLAQTVTQGHTHAKHANRLFWKVNRHTLIGRFYLRHMLCIKPEKDDFLIGSSCDYSFIPEMCPSGNVAHIQDSDEYCVIEMAPYKYENQFLEKGSYKKKELADRLSKWATKEHRSNAYIPVIFHSEELGGEHVNVLKESKKFIEEIEEKLSPAPQPARSHPYWMACMECLFHWLLKQPDRSPFHRGKTFAGVVGSPTFFPFLSKNQDDRFVLKASYPPSCIPLTKNQKKKSLFNKLLVGRPLNSFIWNYRWLDDACLKKAVNDHIKPDDSCVLIAFESITNLINWLEKERPNRFSYYYYDLFKKRSDLETQIIFENKKHAVIYLTEIQLRDAAWAMQRCAQFLPCGGSILILIRTMLQPKKNLYKNLSILLAGLEPRLFLAETKVCCNYPTKLFSKLLEFFVNGLFSPGKSIWIRIGAFIGFMSLNTVYLAINLLSLVGLKNSKKMTSGLIKFKILN